MANALSRKEVLEYVFALTSVQLTFLEKVRKQSNSDSTYKKLKQNVVEGMVHRYWVEDDVLYARGHMLYVPTSGRLRQELLHETYDLAWVGHSGVEQIMALISQYYYWPKMEH